jgi:hypothetical protein
MMECFRCFELPVTLFFLSFNFAMMVNQQGGKQALLMYQTTDNHVDI